MSFETLDWIQSGLRATFRQSNRRRWHLATIVIMLALGIAGSTAVFSFLYQILLQPTRIAEPSRLVEVHQTTPPRDARFGITILGGLPFAGMQEQRAQNRAFAGIAIATNEHLGLVVTGQEARRVRTEFVSAGYFETLGVHLRMGRPFRRDEEVKAEPFVVISDRLWRRASDGDAGVLGRDVLLNGHACRVIGVAPDSFSGHELAERADVWMAWGARAAIGLEPAQSGTAIARLKAGVTLAQAASLAATIGDHYLAGLSAEQRDTVGRHRVRPFDLNRGALLASLLPAPWLLLTVPLLMLLLACANVANLQLADIEVRRREFASRAALGASPGALLRQVFGESLVPAFAACALGLLLAYPCMTLLQRVPTQKMNETRLDVVLQPQAGAFAVALALLSVLLVALLPATRASRANLADTLKGGAGAVVPGGRLKDGLVALQVGLALMLVTCGVLVTRSLDAARNRDLGLRPDNVVGMRLQFGTTGDARANAAKVQRLLEGARALPGVREATVSAGFPLENAAATAIGTERDGLVAAMVGADYFATLGVKIVAGREFTPEDFAAGLRVAIVNQAAAKSYWPGLDPVGRMLGKYRVVGVVADHAAFAGVDMHEPTAFVRLPAQVGTWPCVLVRTEGRPEAVISSLRQLARHVDPTAPILRIATLRDYLDGLHHNLLVASWLLGLCALASLALAAMGVHGLLAYRVTRQRREIGLRMALGAARHVVVRMVVARMLWGVLAGVAAGSAGAFLLARAFRSLFAGAGALQGGTLALSAVVLLVAALLASAGPSWKAARVEPSAALRVE